ncbi:MAG: glycosyltransferase [Rhodocyclaceae bacterium]|nr:glycosyltransferase [Rhodocyclaceae bacterium]
MNILILIGGLQMGGGERMACFLAGRWAEAGHAVSILTLDGPHRPYFELDRRVSLHHLGVSGPSRGFWEMLVYFRHRIGKVRRFIQSADCDVVIGFGSPCMALAPLAVAGLRAKAISREQSDPLFTEREMGKLKRTIHRLALRRADAIVVQSDAARAVLGAGQRRRTSVIPNPIRPVTSRAAPGVPGADGRYKMVALGRLDPVKGYEMLLRAWARIHSRLPQWVLVIHGEGAERDHLESIIAEAGLAGRAFLPGSTDEAEARLAEAHLFVLTSRNEGFPNSLCEAMAVGLPVVATDCRCGPADIVRPGQDGLLVPVDDIAAIADALLSLASDPERRTAMGAEAREGAARFETGKILAMWDAVLDRLGKG